MIRYEIKENLLPNNLNHPNYNTTELIPQGVTIHETATPEATDENESEYFHRENIQASAHYFVDWDSITRIIPENERAWHAGSQANTRFLSIEMCNTNYLQKFIEAWNRMIWLTADICKRYKFNPFDINQLNYHLWVSETWGETDHVDPIGYFARNGKTWGNFVNDVNNLLKEMYAMEDQNISAWAITAVSKAKNSGLMLGDEKGNWNPKQSLTREQFATILDRLGLLDQYMNKQDRILK